MHRREGIEVKRVERENIRWEERRECGKWEGEREEMEREKDLKPVFEYSGRKDSLFFMNYFCTFSFAFFY